MKRHPIDLVAFVLGLLFMALATGFLFDALEIWHADIGWVPPIVLVALGLAGVLSTATRASRGREAFSGTSATDSGADEPENAAVEAGEATDELAGEHLA